MLYTFLMESVKSYTAVKQNLLFFSSEANISTDAIFRSILINLSDNEDVLYYLSTGHRIVSPH
jgi:hypothetical protein